VTAEAGILTIKGERKKAHEVKDADYQYSEVFAGRLGGDTPGKFDQPVQIGSNHRIFRGPSGSRSNRKECRPFREGVAFDSTSGMRHP
jgi:hypothetical protein